MHFEFGIDAIVEQLQHRIGVPLVVQVTKCLNPHIFSARFTGLFVLVVQIMRKGDDCLRMTKLECGTRGRWSSNRSGWSLMHLRERGETGLFIHEHGQEEPSTTQMSHPLQVPPV